MNSETKEFKNVEMERSLTDAVPVKTSKPSSSKKGKNRGPAKAKQQEEFRVRKNNDTQAKITAGIMARLGIKEPTVVPAVPIAREIHPVIAPITFRRLPANVDRIWDMFQAIGTRPFQNLDTPANKMIFCKIILILAEAKLCYAQRAKVDKPDEELPQRKLYTLEELDDLNQLVVELPYPVAMILECIGNTQTYGQVVTPVLTRIEGEYDAWSACLSYGPRHLLPLLRLLNAGTVNNEVVAEAIGFLGDLPGFEIVPGGPGVVRLSANSSAFWLDGDPGQEKIKLTDAETRIFEKIIHSLRSCKDLIVHEDLSHGNGELAQIVMVPHWRVDTSCQWYTMCDCPEYYQKLGIAYGFMSYEYNTIMQQSRFIGTYSTSYWRGEMTPRRVINAICANDVDR